MANFSFYPLQKAIYDALANDTALIALVTGVFDRVPQGQDYPYVTIGESAGADWSTKTTTGMEFTPQISVWTRDGSRREASIILEQVHRLLHDVNLSVLGHTLISIRFVTSIITIESDGWTYRGVMRFRALLQ